MPRKGCLRPLKVSNEGPLLELQRSQQQKQGRIYDRFNFSTPNGHLSDLGDQDGGSRISPCKSEILEKKGKVAISSRGASGGIGTLWDDKKFKVVDIKYSSCWILTLLRQKDTNTLVRIFNIYAPNSYAEKKSVETSFVRKGVTWKEM